MERWGEEKKGEREENIYVRKAPQLVDSPMCPNQHGEHALR